MKISYRLSAAAFLICVAATSPGCTRENNTAPAVAVDDFKTTKEQQIEMRPLVQVAVESRTDNGQSPDDTRMLSITSVQVALGTLKGQKLRDVRDFLDFIGVASRLTGRLAPDQESVVVDVEKTLTNLDADPEEELLIHVIATNKTAESPARGEREYHPLKFADLHIIAVIDADATGARSAGAQGLYHLTENNLESLTVRTAPVRTKEFKDVIVEYGVRNEGGQGAARYSRTLVFALLDGKLAELLDTYGDDDPSEATPGDLAGLRMEIGTDVPATATWFDAATSNVIFRKSLNTAIGAYTLMPELSPEDIELESKTSDGSKLAKPVCPEGSGQKVCGR